MKYTYDRAERVSQAKPPKFRMEYNLIGRKLAEHMEKGYKLLN